jgi:RNA ligase
MKLTDLLSASELIKMMDEKYVKAQHHPTLPYTIYNYTDKCMWDRAWNDVTQQCRGLIVDGDGLVIARPWRKFFNYGEYNDEENPGRDPASKPYHATLDLIAPVQTTDKFDGSLGILYPTPQGWSVATRGSFTSEQAVRASFLWHKRRYNEMPVPEGWTMLFEIVYPENRIVLDYAGLDDLVLLGAVEIETGRTIGPDDFRLIPWQGPQTEVFSDRTLNDALRRHPRPNAEGVVVRYLDGPLADTMVKIKQDDYVALHRIITGMNARSVWERLGAGETLPNIMQQVPEEFWTWITDVGNELYEELHRISTAAYDEYNAIKGQLDHGWTRKDFALKAKDSEHKSLLFLLLDGRDVQPLIWKNIKPSGEDSMKYISEDVA